MNGETIIYVTLGILIFIAVTALTVAIVIGYRRLKLQALGMMTYNREFSTDAIFVGETLELVETVVNTSWFPIINLRMEFFVPAGLTIDDIKCAEHRILVSVFNVPPFSTVTKRHTVTVSRRNHYALHNAGFKYRKFDYSFDCPVDFYAYPDYFDLKNHVNADLVLNGNAVSAKKYIEDPFFLSGVREYRAGDPMRAINFKASARAFSGGIRTLMSNSYDSSRTFDTMIFLDMNVRLDAGIYNGDFLEEGLKCACYLFCEAVQNGGRVGFSVNQPSGNEKYVYIPCESGFIHTKRILNRFAELDNFTDKTYSMSAILSNHYTEIPKCADIYLITTSIDERTAEILAMLERSGRNTHIVNPI